MRAAAASCSRNMKRPCWILSLFIVQTNEMTGTKHAQSTPPPSEDQRKKKKNMLSNKHASVFPSCFTPVTSGQPPTWRAVPRLRSSQQNPMKRPKHLHHSLIDRFTQQAQCGLSFCTSCSNHGNYGDEVKQLRPERVSPSTSSPSNRRNKLQSFRLDGKKRSQLKAFKNTCRLIGWLLATWSFHGICCRGNTYVGV